MHNRRADQRYTVSLSVELHSIGGTLPAQVINMSLGGMGIRLKTAPSTGAQVALSLFITEDGIEDETTPPLSLSGKVAWVEPLDSGGHQAGIRFASMGPLQMRTLRGFLERINA